MHRFCIIGLSAAVLTAGCAQTAQASNGCGHYSQHVYEACTAYVVNDAHLSLQLYFKYVHSSSIFAFLQDRFALKYSSTARAQIRAMVAAQGQPISSWPHDTNTVVGPNIRIVKARSSLRCNRTVLDTRESWQVVAPNGSTLYRETNQEHTVVLRRVPDQRFQFAGHVLHAWIVDQNLLGEVSLPLCP